MSGVKAAFTLVKAPISTPSGNETATASAKPSTTRVKDTARLRVTARSNHSSGNDATTSTGEGRIVGEITRSSAAPVVTIIHKARSASTGSSPSTTAFHAASGSRMRRKPVWAEAGGPGRAGAGPPAGAGAAVVTSIPAGRRRPPRAG